MTGMRDFASEFAGKSASTDDFRAIAEKYYGDQLTWFFSQWLDSTGAPEFKVKYTTYRLGGATATQNAKEEKIPGFRVTGEISQDLDLFRMPVDLRIDTDGRTENKRIDVVGTNSPFAIETFGRPRRISVDADHHVLTNSSDVKLRSSILRGQAMLVSVTERTKEIGLRKALGATYRAILTQFFIEGAFLTAFSGGIGLSIAIGFVTLLAMLPSPEGFDTPRIIPASALAAIGSLAIAGIAAGLYPARKAALLPPVEALRQE